MFPVSSRTIHTLQSRHISWEFAPGRCRHKSEQRFQKHVFFSRRTFSYSPIAWNVTVACVGDRAVGFLRQRHECDVGWGVGQENLGEKTWHTNIFDRCLFLAPVPCIMARYHGQKNMPPFSKVSTLSPTTAKARSTIEKAATTTAMLPLRSLASF